MALAIYNLQPIRNLAIRRPADDQLGLPAQAANLLQLADLRNGYGEDGIHSAARLARPFGGVVREADARRRGRRADVHPAFLALVAGLEVDGARRLLLFGRRQDAEVLLGRLGAEVGPEFVHAELGLDAGFRGAFEEAEDATAVFGFGFLVFVRRLV